MVQEGWLAAERSEATAKCGPRQRVLCRQPPQPNPQVAAPRANGVELTHKSANSATIGR